LDELLDLTEKISSEKLQKFIGKKVKVLTEERVENEDLFIGRFWGQAPEVDGLTVVESLNAVPGDFITVKIKKINNKDFYAVEA
jgi:ribosomal protein S12 methylthiotransferase